MTTTPPRTPPPYDAAGQTVHELKTWPGPFAAVLSGEKRHEIRVNDRGFAVGDVLQLREWVPNLGILPADAPPYDGYTGRYMAVNVTYITRGGEWGMPADLCVMTIATLTPKPQTGGV